MISAAPPQKANHKLEKDSEFGWRSDLTIGNALGRCFVVEFPEDVPQLRKVASAPA